MYNPQTDIIVDLSRSSNSNRSSNLNLKPEYYKLCIENMIDTLNEGSDCLCKNHYRVIFLAEDSKFNEDFIPDKIENYSIDFRKESYDTIYNLIKEMKYIILGENILSYFSLWENKNPIEDMVVIGFEYDKIQFRELREFKLSKVLNLEIYIDKNSKSLRKHFYIKNPLLKTEHIKISDLNLIEN